MSSDSETKYVILVPDGMADLPMPQLDGATPLKAAKTPWMDKLAAAGEVGLARTVPEGMDPGSDIANLSIMGYSPRQAYTGRAPFEAASMGITLLPSDVAFRVNLVTLERNYTVMSDHSADHISTPEAHDIISEMVPIAEQFGLAIVPGVSYRNLLVWRDGPENCVTHAPHDFPGEFIATKLPTGDGADVLLRLIIKSWRLFENHPVNKRRKRRGQGPANSVWPWGQGRAPRIRTLKQRFGISGSVVAAVDLVRGIGKYAGLDLIDVPGATGYLDTNYQGKVDAALESLKQKDFVFLHVEAPDEAGHSGQLDLKVKAIEDFDEKVVGPILTGLQEFPKWRILLMPDHHTPTITRVHSSDPVPFILLDSDKWDPAAKEPEVGFTEEKAAASGKFVEDASKMIELLLQKN
ncbi:MAG: cofactor-independent phosphoglycerate mutase [Desulfomonile tiedjei]|uniref:Cofactor-independent phosphoglycerate mutase n=1 Tax=Desulfomonile tiedjei TaxID=2358 RepID=A0A9D6V5W2_9BACT|nr:cofactor-independent phosphoglycerate mutase [Desulfomonile tiedjei]